MTDKVEEIRGSRVQHGKLNDRVYLIDISRNAFPEIVGRLDSLAKGEGYSKIFAKVPDWALHEFERAGHEIEAVVPGFFGGDTDGYFTGKFLEEGRMVEARPETVKEVLDAADLAPAADATPLLPPGLDLHEALPSDAGPIAEVYRDVFATYPFPIHEPAFIEESIESGETRFFVVRDREDIVALASSEIDLSKANAEMTDFATLPEYRGRNLASCLLYAMEKEMRKVGVKVLYTIARAYSFGMNIVFAKQGYSHAGTLTNNTNISGGLESMNVWFKVL